MLSNLRIKNFRMLEDLEIQKLGRVNLIVGKNNSGKSTLLEALRIYAGNANPMLLREILIGHDESLDIEGDSISDSPDGSWFSLKNLFHNRTFPNSIDDSISILSNDKEILRIEQLFYKINEESDVDENNQVIGIIRRRLVVTPEDINKIDDSLEGNQITPAVRVTPESGRVQWIDLPSDLRRSINSRTLEYDSANNFSFVSTEFLGSNTLAKLWDRITLGEYENIVLSALQIIDPSVERLAFIEDRSRYSSREVNRLSIVKMKDSESRIPLNSMGDGMSRILQLILSVFPAKDGILLIDEFENGLHFSVQEEVWKIIFKLATELNIQVFATTHSWDCIESFTKVANESPEQGLLIKVSKSKLTSDKGKTIATIYDEAALRTVTATDLEVR